MVPETPTTIRIDPITTGIIITSTTTITTPAETTITATAIATTITKLVGTTIPITVVEVTREIEDRIDNERVD